MAAITQFILMTVGALLLSGCSSIKTFPGHVFDKFKNIGEHEVQNHENYGNETAPRIIQTATPRPYIKTREVSYTKTVSTPVEKQVKKRIHNQSPATTIDKANKRARVSPDESSYNNAIMRYQYSSGALYQIYAAPLRITDIQLQPSEKIIGKPAAGDTARWILGINESIENGQPQKHILIKPTRPNLKTTLIINTNRRTYLLELNSYKQSYMAAVNWHYPQDELRKRQAQQKAARLKQEQLRQQALEAAKPVHRNFTYKIAYRGEKPKWIPVQVFDDNNKVYIRFSKDRQRYEAPALFIITKKGETQLVNYRITGNYYIVDRLFDTAELRAGQDTPTVITIRKKDS